MEALAPFTVDNYKQDVTSFPYLQHDDPYNFDIMLQVDIKREHLLFLWCSESLSTIITDAWMKWNFWSIVVMLHDKFLLVLLNKTC